MVDIQMVTVDRNTEYIFWLCFWCTRIL